MLSEEHQGRGAPHSGAAATGLRRGPFDDWEDEQKTRAYILLHHEHLIWPEQQEGFGSMLHMSDDDIAIMLLSHNPDLTTDEFEPLKRDIWRARKRRVGEQTRLVLSAYTFVGVLVSAMPWVCLLTGTVEFPGSQRTMFAWAWIFAYWACLPIFLALGGSTPRLASRFRGYPLVYPVWWILSILCMFAAVVQTLILWPVVASVVPADYPMSAAEPFWVFAYICILLLSACIPADCGRHLPTA